MIRTFLEASEQTQIIILSINLIFTVYYLAIYKSKEAIKFLFLSIIVIGGLYFVVRKFSGVSVIFFFLYYQLPAIVATVLLSSIWALIKKLIPQKKLDAFDVRIELKNGKSIIVNIWKGVSVQGAAGSGKTISVAGWILHWMGQRGIPGLIYDYKDFEFTEIILWFYRNATLPVNVFSPGDPSKSISLNPIDPKVLNTKEDILLMGKCVVNSVLTDEQKGNKFFVEAAEGAITGVIIKLKEDYPEYCSFSYLVAIFLVKDIEGLVTFIESNPTAKRQARAFLDSADSSKQMAGVKGTLSNAFRMFDVPGIMFCMRKNDVNLALNHNNEKSVLSLVNKPKYGDIYEPLFSIVSQAVILEMSQRNREPAYLMFDEAPTLKVPKIERVPATMRSFNIATIYMLQDKVQAVNQLGLNKMKEVLANLSTLFFGKTNDPDTAKFFESYFEDIKIKQKSISRKNGVFFEGSDARTTISEKEEKKHKSFEMFKRSTGQFFVFDEKGKSYDAIIKKPEIEPMLVKNINSVTDWELKKTYDTIFKNAEKI